MNSWNPEQFHESASSFQYQMMMPMNPGMQNEIPPALPPPQGMMLMGMGGPEWNQNPGSGLVSGPIEAENFIGPIPPEDQDTTMDLTQDEVGKQGYDINASNNRGSKERQGNHKHGESRWSRTKDRDNKDRGDRGRHPRSQDRNRGRGDRSRSDRGRDNRDRGSRFKSRDKPPMQDMPVMPGQAGLGGPGNVMMSGMMPYGNTMIPGQQPIDMQDMPNIPNMQNPSIMSNINVHPNMMGNMMPNIMPGMMEQNMMMAQQMQMMSQQPIITQAGVLLTPIPGVTMPRRRERPVGCRTIFVGGLPPGIGFDNINEIFQRFGGIDDIKLHQQGVCHIRFSRQEMVEQSFMLSGFRFKSHDQSDNEATTLFIDYALNRDDQSEGEKQSREPTPPRIEPYTATALATLTEKIKSDTDFAESAPTLAGWLERGEVNKKNANTFYSLIQSCNNQVRRLYNEKMAVDEEFFNLKTTMKDKFAQIIFQFEQVAKILSAAKHKRASDHFSKQQRRNIEMWLKMTEDLENIREEFNMMFDDDEIDKIGQKLVSAEKYEQLKTENDTLICELEGYKNEAHLARDEAERKFEKFKAHFIAQQALQGGNRLPQQAGIFPPLPPPPPMPSMDLPFNCNAPPTPEEMKQMSAALKQDAKLVAMLTAFLLAHPLGATIDYLASYVRSMVPDATQNAVHTVLLKHGEIFAKQAKDRWSFVLFDIVKKEGH